MNLGSIISMIINPVLGVGVDGTRRIEWLEECCGATSARNLLHTFSMASYGYAKDAVVERNDQKLS